ncbi:hypothetical protein SERLA73DRAFT_177371 [Serpula lacrymans var. lacrymans S7.3]|uniref:Uncharacterized protein n=2 Tax=Serpula lacrymans var. lacrymans TaxID=341189 RepID=F8PNW3_SERL3|nr:uncharacterized protein SERLADRAFT_460934 [Serpula lacrymans var. lacrymans S7.9]EGO01840.1 hypothetical protein SERLA73DRAFT_177371 [Serpula lacrymans var. lacrymans S7.3]EGO27467.1 hypothetical protein SERLADRAFT_460934 [Serpula lacrymans var. lacrymans S7.9]
MMIATKRMRALSRPHSRPWQVGPSRVPNSVVKRRSRTRVCRRWDSGVWGGRDAVKKGHVGR